MSAKIHKKKIGYIIITDHDPHSFIQKVNLYMEDGWEIWGSPTTPNYSDEAGMHIQYCQAMMLYEEKEEKNAERIIAAIRKS